MRRAAPSAETVRTALAARAHAHRVRMVRAVALILVITASAVLLLLLLTACGPDAFTTKCNNDGGVEHVDKDRAGHPVARICTKGGHVIHKAPLPTPIPQGGGQ